MESNSKVKIRDFAKDLDAAPADIIEVVRDYLGVEKKVGASFAGEELDIVLEKLSQDNQVDSFEDYFGVFCSMSSIPLSIASHLGYGTYGLALIRKMDRQILFS